MTQFEADRVDDDLAVIRPKGRLNMVAAPRLRSLVSDTVKAGCRRIVVDLSETEFMDSSGLGALIAGLKSARQAGGDLRIACPTEQVATVLKLTNLDRVLRPHTSVAGAFGAR
jgi:anti-sigma B factor antagonist